MSIPPGDKTASQGHDVFTNHPLNPMNVKAEISNASLLLLKRYIKVLDQCFDVVPVKGI